MELQQLIRRCKNQERDAQELLYRRYKDTLFILSLKYCRSREQAHDNLHDAFVSIFQSIDRYKGTGSFEGWMKRIVINKAINKYKDKTLLNVVLNEEITKDVSLEESSLEHLELSKILELIQKLPDRYRLVFNLYELDGFTHQEIADVLGISTGTSKSNLHRSKLILKEQINALRLNNKNYIKNGS